MDETGISPDTQKALLRRYEPVMRFSAGENYFPTRVDWHVANSKLRKHVPRGPDDSINQFYSKTAVTLDSEEADERLAALPPNILAEAHEHYLRFVPSRPAWYTVLMMALLAFHALVIAIGMHPDNFGAIGPALYNVADYRKVAVLAAIITIWPLIEANRKVHFALILNLFAALFFGTLQGVGFGLLAVAFMLGAMVLFGFRWATLPLEQELTLRTLNQAVRRGVRNRSSRREQEEKPRSPTLTALTLLGIPLLALLVYFMTFALLKLLVAVGLVSSFPYRLPTRFGRWVLDPSISGAFVISATLLLYLVWTRIGDRRGQQPVARRVPPQLLNLMRVMLLSSTLIVVTWLAGRWLGLHRDYFGRGILSVVLILEAAIAGFWFYINPLKVVKRDNFVSPYNRPTYTLGWNPRTLTTILLGSVVWAAGSALTYLDVISNRWLLFTLINVAVTILALGTDLARYVFDLFSSQPDSAALRAGRRYRDIIRAHRDAQKASQLTPRRYTYYGRASEQDGWVILQYFYFYAFNDWRSTARGMNHHEGDWEAVSIFLQRQAGQPHEDYAEDDLKPFGVAYSQHHDGQFCFWDPPPGVTQPGDEDRVVKKVSYRAQVQGPPRQATTHPLVYPALGSHANYPWPNLYSTTVHYRGFVRDVLGAVDRFLSGYKPPDGLGLNLQDQKLADDHTIQARPMQALEPGRKPELEKADDLTLTGDPPGGLPVEYAAGDGLRVGVRQETFDLSSEFKWPARLPDGVLWHETEQTFRQSLLVVEGYRYEWVNNSPVKVYNEDWKWSWDELTWECELVSDDFPGWVQFPGLWGRRSGADDESGPPGPRWDRPQRDDAAPQKRKVRPRMRWGRKGDLGLDWMDTLLFEMAQDEEVSLDARRLALATLARH